MIRLSRVHRTACIALVLSAASACSAGRAQFGGSRPGVAEEQVYETVTRWIHRNYRPSGDNGVPAAFCLAAGRRAFTAVDRYRRGEDERWVPSQRLLDQLNDLQPDVRPVSDCWVDDETQERLGRDGPPAVLLLMQQPNWTSPSTADIVLRTRENNIYAYEYLCRVETRGSQWRVVDCI